MIKLAWRQFRSQGLMALGLLALVTVIAAVSRPYLADAVAEVSASGPLLEGPLIVLSSAFTIIVVGAPVLCGVFWGAPLIARELETGTFRMIWTQSVTRAHWLGMKLLVVGLAAIAVTGLLSLIVSWWSGPLFNLSVTGFNIPNRFDQLSFSAGGIVPLGYGAFGFMLGASTGLLLRRTLPAMGLTLAIFAAVRMLTTYLVRPYFMAPVKTSLPLTSDVVHVGLMKAMDGVVRLEPEATVPNAWVYSVDIVDEAGNLPTADFLQSAGEGSQGLRDILDKLVVNYHAVVTNQPADRYWAFQGMETAIFLVLALLLAWLCFWWVRRRIV
jgi:hypothetical protein